MYSSFDYHPYHSASLQPAQSSQSAMPGTSSEPQQARRIPVMSRSQDGHATFSFPVPEESNSGKCFSHSFNPNQSLIHSNHGTGSRNMSHGRSRSPVTHVTNESCSPAHQILYTPVSQSNMAQQGTTQYHTQHGRMYPQIRNYVSHQPSAAVNVPGHSGLPDPDPSMLPGRSNTPQSLPPESHTTYADYAPK